MQDSEDPVHKIIKKLFTHNPTSLKKLLGSGRTHFVFYVACAQTCSDAHL